MKAHDTFSDQCWCRPAIRVIHLYAADMHGTVAVHNVDSSASPAVKLESAQTNEADTSEHHFRCRCRRCIPDDLA
jgi:hypothetical protein